MYTRETELYHHGVLGMKWGKRKANSAASIAKADYKSAKKGLTILQI